MIDKRKCSTHQILGESKTQKMSEEERERESLLKELAKANIWFTSWLAFCSQQTLNIFDSIATVAVGALTY